jgi:hypothetical protein
MDYQVIDFFRSSWSHICFTRVTVANFYGFFCFEKAQKEFVGENFRAANNENRGVE